MSSRSGAARKRLASPEEKKVKEKRPASTKGGLFSRLKSNSTSKTGHTTTTSSLSPSSTRSLLPSEPPTPASPPNHPPQYSRSHQHQEDHFRKNEPIILRATQPNPSPYPSPPNEPTYAYHLDSARSHNPPSAPVPIRIEADTGSGPTFVEATYQAPPPSRARAGSSAGQRPLPSIPAKSALAISNLASSNEFEDSLAAFPPPPSYPPSRQSSRRDFQYQNQNHNQVQVQHNHLPSPAMSPEHRSLLLQPVQRAHSPTPTELPSYSSTQASTSSGAHTTSSPAPSSRRPSIQSSGYGSPRPSGWRPEHQQYLDPWHPPNTANTTTSTAPSSFPSAHSSRLNTPSPLLLSMGSTLSTTASTEHLRNIPTSESELGGGPIRPWVQQQQQPNRSVPGTPESSKISLLGPLPITSTHARPPPSIAPSESSSSSGAKSDVLMGDAPAARLPPLSYVFPSSSRDIAGSPRVLSSPSQSSGGGTQPLKLGLKNKLQMHVRNNSRGSLSSIPDMPRMADVFASTQPRSQTQETVLADDKSIASWSASRSTSPHVSSGDLPRTIVPPKPEAAPHSEPQSAFSDDSIGAEVPRPRKASVSTTTTTSSGSNNSKPSTPGTATTFVFPSSRSRAAPRKAPSAAKIRPLHKEPSTLSDSSSDRSSGRKTRFLGLPIKTKKKAKESAGIHVAHPTTNNGARVGAGLAVEVTPDPKTPSSGSEFSSQQNEGSVVGSTVSQTVIGSTTSSVARERTVDAALRYGQNLESVSAQSRKDAQRIRSRIGNYPLDPYDSVLLDNDRHTGELLARLNSTNSPTFHNFGNMPPTSVLDLGCGQGHWVVDAAIAWKGFGTKVTGYDMVDITKGLLPWAVEQGVTENIRFVRGNFLKQRLPFNDNSFDLVRMSCLALCITSDSWIFVLQEVARVLMPGGRLELIDDLIFFPYGKSSSPTLGLFSAQSSPASIAPQLDINIPTSSFSTYSIYDGITSNPGLGLAVEPPDPEEMYNLYGVVEEEQEQDMDDSATINGDVIPKSVDRDSPSPMPRGERRGARATPTPEVVLPYDYQGITPQSWARAHATAQDLEALFGHMLQHKFGIHKDPSGFVLGLLKEVFGHAREVKTMHLTLAPPETTEAHAVGAYAQSEKGQRPDSSELPYARSGSSRPSSRRPNSSNTPKRKSPGLSQATGLILLPSTFLPMDQGEVEIHASKHLRMLLSCKNHLVEHAIEATDDEEIDEDAILEALWEYEGFLRHRFNPPTSVALAAVREPVDVVSDAASVRESIAESVSSEVEAMWEIQSEFREHFAWSADRLPSSHQQRPSTPRGPLAKVEEDSSITPTTPTTALPSVTSPSPAYSREELTHVRTFRVYEAIKLDETLLQLSMSSQGMAIN